MLNVEININKKNNIFVDNLFGVVPGKFHLFIGISNTPQFLKGLKD